MEWKEHTDNMIRALVRTTTEAEAATLWHRGCNPMRPGLQPYAIGPATLCDRGCNPMCVCSLQVRTTTEAKAGDPGLVSDALRVLFRLFKQAPFPGYHPSPQ